MSAFDATSAHRKAQEALPWLANGSLARPNGTVQAHLRGLRRCRDDLELLRAAAHDAGPGAAPAATRSAPWRACCRAWSLPRPGSRRRPSACWSRWRARLAANDRGWLRAPWRCRPA
jgi:hypothetical protein